MEQALVVCLMLMSGPDLNDANQGEITQTYVYCAPVESGAFNLQINPDLHLYIRPDLLRPASHPTPKHNPARPPEQVGQPTFFAM